MILVDTSIWVDHFRRGDPHLVELLEGGSVLAHPFVIGEIACGSLSDRSTVLELLHELPMSPVADPEEALAFIERRGLHGKGIGYIDIHLLAATLLARDALLWTRDKRLQLAAQALRCAYGK